MCSGSDLGVVMRNIKFAGRRNVNPPQRQRGVVLLIALIVLVAMMLAGIGMMRSIDTTTMIAGNVAYRQATLQAGDSGFITAYNTLLAVATNGADKIVLNFSDGTAAPAGVCPGVSAYLCSGGNVKFAGYRATPVNTCEVYPPGSPLNACPPNLLQPPNGPWWTKSANWNLAPTINVTDNSVPPNTVATVSYWIDRMCSQADTYPNGVSPSGAPQVCQTALVPGTSGGGSHQVGSYVFTSVAVFYRITTKSVGPRNTVTYSQSLVLLPE